jgi:gamma-glutamylputrescine oxidase
MGIDQSKLASVLHKDMCKIYPQLSTSTKVEVAWSGVMGYARHKMPLIGKLTSSGNPLTALSSSSKDFPENVWYVTGFGGHGVCPTTVAGEVIAKAIAEGDDTYKLFKPFGLEWTGGPYLGAAAAQAFYWWYGARDLAKSYRLNGKAAI